MTYKLKDLLNGKQEEKKKPIEIIDGTFTTVRVIRVNTGK